MSVFVAKSVHETTPQIRWMASLSNGETIYEDATNHSNKSAWQRLAEYIVEQNVSITNLRLQRGADIIEVPGNQKGYCFGRKIQTTAPPNSITINWECVGWLDENDTCHLTWARIPDFMHRKTEQRTSKKAGFFLIKNNA
jgi:hypothetical protein